MVKSGGMGTCWVVDYCKRTREGRKARQVAEGCAEGEGQAVGKGGRMTSCPPI